MALYTNNGLVNHAKKALALKTKYMWGGLLRKITPAYIDLLRSIYGIKAGTGYTELRYQELKNLVGQNYYGVDCVGLIKSYYWSGKVDGGTDSPNYGAAGYPDVNANYMYQQARVKGTIDTIPEIPGLIVYSKSHPHVGIYIGNGYTIESTLGSRGDGVVKRKLDGFWEYWFECPYITYEKPVTTLPQASLKPLDVIATEVINGLWGTGDTRKKKLEEAGYEYAVVQNKVNELLKKQEPAKKKEDKPYNKNLARTFTTLSRLNMRAGAGIDKKVITIIPKNAKVTGTGYYTNDWYYVKYGKYEGFCKKDFLK